MSKYIRYVVAVLTNIIDNKFLLTNCRVEEFLNMQDLCKPSDKKSI